jgi:hypothetical protein|uniref:hypothetical protein n=1 Tax=Limnohabitans sp. TaxID=1907725 RepID=UPI004047B3B4
MAFKLGRGIDANYHPKKYFYDFDTGLPVKGAMLQAAYRSAVLESDHGAAEAILLNSPTNDQERQLLGSLHPSLMGGLYLPDRAHAEVEVARVTIASTTMDVTCIFASPTAEGISFRVVDEYEGETLNQPAQMIAGEPLKLIELINFFFTSWDLTGCLEGNFADWGYPRHEIHNFIVSANSDFYPQFSGAVHRYIDWWLNRVKRR